MQPFLVAILIMVCALHSLAHVSRPYANYILVTIKVALLGMVTISRGSSAFSDEQRRLLRRLPSDVRTAMHILDLHPDITVYASCPSCFSIYAPTCTAGTVRTYPSTCTFTETDRPPCNEPLLEPKDRRAARRRRKAGRSLEDLENTPRRPYPFRSMKSWIAEMLGRSGMAALMKDGWDRSSADAQSSSSTWKDIMNAPALRQFLGPDGRTLFSVQPDGSVHLLLSLFVDWFNPYGNKQAGKSHSIGAIYMACLNLPPHLRYRPENIYLVAIIPGPQEPHLHQLNHLLEPLVDELLQFWDRGVYVSGAAGRATGLLVRAAVIPLVCDLPALRKTAGFAHHSARRFCSFCPLPKEDINNVDRDTWPPHRSWSEHLKAAGAWRDASTEADRLKLFTKDGLRWSQLLRLPYWDPTRFALVDAMHNLFLGELHHHCLTIWGLKTAEGRGNKKRRMASHSPAVQQTHLNRIAAGLQAGVVETVASVRKDYLETVLECNPFVVISKAAPAKVDYASALVQWVRSNGHAMICLRCTD